jgi:hypothetical protein
MEPNRRSAWVVVLFLLGGGCSPAATPVAVSQPRPEHIVESPTVHTALLATGTPGAPGRPADCHLDLVLDRTPVQPFVVLGRASAVWTATGRTAAEATDESALEALRGRACQAGAHALFSVRSHFQDHWLPPAIPGDTWAFARTVRATALAVVYVSRDGSVLAPPERARRVIRVPRRLEPRDRPPAGPPEDAATGLAWDRGITDPWGVPVP